MAERTRPTSEWSQDAHVLEQVGYELRAYHRAKDNDSRTVYAVARNELARATRSLFMFIDRGVPIVVKFNDTTPKLRYTGKNAYDFVTLEGSRDTQPGEELELHKYNQFPGIDGLES